MRQLGNLDVSELSRLCGIVGSCPAKCLFILNRNQESEDETELTYSFIIMRNVVTLMGRIWLERLMKMQQKAQTALRGRYARFDQLNRSLLTLTALLLLLNLFVSTTVFLWIGLAALVLAYYRFFSKRIYPRANENTKFVAVQQRWKRRWQQIITQIKWRKTYRYFACPNCKQALRAPKGKGKIKVTCATCKTQFVKKV